MGTGTGWPTRTATGTAFDRSPGRKRQNAPQPDGLRAWVAGHLCVRGQTFGLRDALSSLPILKAARAFRAAARAADPAATPTAAQESRETRPNPAAVTTPRAASAAVETIRSMASRVRMERLMSDYLFLVRAKTESQSVHWKAEWTSVPFDHAMNGSPNGPLSGPPGGTYSSAH